MKRTTNQHREVRMEHYENGGGTAAKLRWAYVGYRTHAVPQKRLYAAP